jgi:hypothetical protein
MPSLSLSINGVPIDADCTGNRWSVADQSQLGKLIAVVAMGQAIHAAEIIAKLKPVAPAFTHASLIDEAKLQLAIRGDTPEKRDASRWRRDGFIFETISWIATQQTKTATTLLKDPHLKSTMQGIDGLVIELDGSGTSVTRATVVEDKCVGDPQTTFRDKVMPCFKDHHKNKRGPELVSAAASLIASTGMSGTDATQAAERVLNLAYRRYLAALTIEATDDAQPRRASIFAGYSSLENITSDQRHAATFVVTGGLRDYFDALAKIASDALDSWLEDSGV